MILKNIAKTRINTMYIFRRKFIAFCTSSQLKIFHSLLFSDNVLVLSIFFNELNYEKIEENFSYGVGIFSSVGFVISCDGLSVFNTEDRD